LRRSGCQEPCAYGVQSRKSAFRVAQGESAHLTSRRDISGRGRGFRTLRERDRVPAAGTWNREEGRFRESEGEEGGGTWNPHRWRGASAPVCPHLGPAALIPSAAANPVRPHLHPGAHQLVPLLLRPPLCLVLSVCLQCMYLFLCSIAYAWLAWTWIYSALLCFLRYEAHSIGCSAPLHVLYNKVALCECVPDD